MTIAAVVVTYKRYAELGKTIISLLEQGLKKEALYVVDNNAEIDRSLNFYSSFKGINVIFSEENIASAGGFAKGMELAHLAGYDWVWLFNDDSRPVEGSLASINLHISQASREKIGLIKIANLNQDGKAVLLFWQGVRKPLLIQPTENLVATDLVTFDGCLISGDLMSSIGYCDPEYFMGTYEFDYCLKAKAAGFSIYTLPNGKIEDGKLGSVGGTPPWRQYYNTRNHLWLGLNRKDNKIIKAWLVREIKFVYAILRFEDHKIERLRFKALAFYHAVKGIRGKRVLPRSRF